MSGDGFIILPFADGVYRFRLGFAHLMELQEECDAGPFEIYNRLVAGFPKHQDYRETIRLALIGGGKGWKGAPSVEELERGQEVEIGVARALALVSKYVDTFGNDGPSWHESRLLAQTILGAGLVGIPGEPVGNGKGAEETPDLRPSQTENSGSDPSSPASPTEE